MAYKQEMWDEAKKKCRLGDDGHYDGIMYMLYTDIRHKQKTEVKWV